MKVTDEHRAAADRLTSQLDPSAGGDAPAVAGYLAAVERIDGVERGGLNHDDPSDSDAPALWRNGAGEMFVVVAGGAYPIAAQRLREMGYAALVFADIDDATSGADREASDA
jgi:hypothetical protein